MYEAGTSLSFMQARLLGGNNVSLDVCTLVQSAPETRRTAPHLAVRFGLLQTVRTIFVRQSGDVEVSDGLSGTYVATDLATLHGHRSADDAH